MSRQVGRVLGAALALLLGLVSPAWAALSITSTSSSVFYTDTSVSPNLLCNYQSFQVTSTTALADAWVSIGSFSTYLGNGGNDDGKTHLGPMSAGQTKTAFFYVCSSYTGSSIGGQGYTLSVTDRDPAQAGALTLASSTVSLSINNSVIQAGTNTVSVIFAGPNPGVLGGLITMTVQGDTGNMGCVNPPSGCTGQQSGPMSFTPASYQDWRADAYELVGSNVLLTGGNAGSYDNMLFLATLASSSNTSYTATYYFRALSTTATTTSLSPIGYIASGNQIKHTDTTKGAYAGSNLLPIQPASNTVLLGKLVSAATLPAQGGRVTYTLRLTNTGTDAVALDGLWDDLPAGASYVAGSSSYGGAALADPQLSGSTRIWSGLFVVPANSSRDLVFQADLPATPGSYTNSATARIGSTVIDTTLSTGDLAPATATTTVLAAPVVAKAFSPVAQAVGGNSQLQLTLSNPNGSHSLNSISLSDVYPAGLQNVGSATSTCSGASLAQTSNSLGLSGLNLAPGASCTLSINTTAAAGSYVNTTAAIASGNGGSGNTASATVIFTTLPTVAKAFAAPSIPAGGQTTLSFTLSNNGPSALSALAFTDLFPAGLVLASPPGLSPLAACGGTVEAWNGSTASPLGAGAPGLRLSGGSLPVGGSCSFSVNVTAASAGIYDNTASGVSSSLGSPGPASNTARLVVMAPPQVSKAFSPASIGRGETSQLSVTLSNPNSLAISGLGFTDNYPLNLVNAASPALSNSCGGTASAAAGGGSLSLSGGSLAAGASCTLSVAVSSAVVNSGGYVNTLPVGSVSTANAGSNAVAASAILVVNPTPSISKSFVVSPVAGTTTLVLTISNNHSTGISGLAFSDNFPVGMVVDSAPTLSNSCGGSVSGAVAGSTSISLSGGTIAGAAPASCTLSLRVRVSSGGEYHNQTSGVSLSSPFAGTGSPSNVATLVAPIIIKSFTPSTVGANDISRLELQITNPSNTVTLSGLTITDSYPAGNSNTSTFLLNAPSPNLSNSCGGSVSASAGSSSLSLSGGSLAPGQFCVVAVDVRANPASPDTYYNVTSTVRSDQGIGGTGADALYIVNKPTITKSFLSNPVTLSGGSATSVMRIRIESNYNSSLSGVALSDVFPSSPGQMRYVNTVSNGCGGTLRDQAGNALVANSSTGIRLSGVTLGANAVCVLDVTVSVPQAGAYDNQTTGATSTTSGFTAPGPVSNVATLIANLASPTVSKSFAASEVAVNGSVLLTLTLSNPNTEAVTSVNLQDNYPGSMLNTAAPGLSNSCGGSATAAAGGGSLSLAAGSIPASSSCTLSVLVTATSPGLLSNSSGTVSTGNAGTAAAATANVTFYAPALAAKSFPNNAFGLGAPLPLRLQLSNPAANPGSLSNLRLSDNLALTGLSLASTTVSFVPAACGSLSRDPSGALQAGDAQLLFSVSSLAPGASCQVELSVAASTVGSFSNTTSPPAAQSPGAVALSGVPAVADFTVVQASLSKAWSAPSISAGGSADLVFTLSNGAGSPAQAGLAFSDNLPADLRFSSASPGIIFSSGCSGTAAVVPGSPDRLNVTGISLANGTASCQLTVSGVSNRSGQLNADCSSNPAGFTNGATNMVDLVWLANGVSNQCLLVAGAASLSLTKSRMVFSDPINNTSNPKSIPGAVAVYTLRVSNNGPGSADANSVIVTDPLPTNMALYVGDLGGSGSGPVLFSEGTPASGLSWVFTALGNATDSLEFSNDGGVSWSYSPTPDGAGFDAAVTHIRLRPQGSMAGNSGTPPFFELSFRVRIQ